MNELSRQGGKILPVDRVGEDVARWLHGAMFDAAGKPKMLDKKVIERSGVARGTFYALRKGRGKLATDATLAALAHALGVPAPRIERRLTAQPPEPVDAPLAILRTIQGLLERLVERLEATSAEAAAAGVARAVQEAEDGDRGKKPKRKRPPRAG